jgi:hypothetical protein
MANATQRGDQNAHKHAKTIENEKIVGRESRGGGGKLKNCMVVLVPLSFSSCFGRQGEKVDIDIHIC